MKEQLSRPASELGFMSNRCVDPVEEVTQRIKAELFFMEMVSNAIHRKPGLDGAFQMPYGGEHEPS